MPNADARFESFLKSSGAIWIIGPAGILFQSQRRGIAPLLCYLEQTPSPEEVVIFDKVTGNAAALLMKKACCCEVSSPIGSEPAAETLNGFGIINHFTQTVPYIINREGSGMCPFETMSLGKSPDEFYELMKRNSLFADIFHGGKP
ncbi:MAG: DUF1893 domain-containing protein [Deltaproteobacteria bacterium]|nr:DUF1893 domain-containing protein [Deltaproteobacteria bacterium]